MEDGLWEQRKRPERKLLQLAELEGSGKSGSCTDISEQVWDVFWRQSNPDFNKEDTIRSTDAETRVLLSDCRLLSDLGGNLELALQGIHRTVYLLLLGPFQAHPQDGTKICPKAKLQTNSQVLFTCATSTSMALIAFFLHSLVSHLPFSLGAFYTTLIECQNQTAC